MALNVFTVLTVLLVLVLVGAVCAGVRDALADRRQRRAAHDLSYRSTVTAPVETQGRVPSCSTCSSRARRGVDLADACEWCCRLDGYDVLCQVEASVGRDHPLALQAREAFGNKRWPELVEIANEADCAVLEIDGPADAHAVSLVQIPAPSAAAGRPRKKPIFNMPTVDALGDGPHGFNGHAYLAIVRSGVGEYIQADPEIPPERF